LDVTDNKQAIGIKLERDYFTPAIQQAMQQAIQDHYKAPDIINGVANAYIHMLKAIFGKDQVVAAFLAAQADYVKNLPEATVH
jgi:hypothetical protein